MQWKATFSVFGLAALVLFTGCATTYEPTPPPRQARGEPLPGTLGPSPATGDPGVVSGRVEVVQSFAPAVPVAFEEIALYRDEAVVAKATTDAHGGFMFVGITNGGVYEARVVSARYEGSVQFSLRRGGHLSGAELVVRPVAPPK
jgi:hypothetical protein